RERPDLHAPLARRRLHGARVLRHVRHPLRRPRGPEAPADAGGLRPPPAAQGLPAPGHRARPALSRVGPRAPQGLAPGGGEVSTRTTFEYARGAGAPLDPSSSRAARDDDDPLHGELMQLNMGPQHPATHGVLRLALELDGETMRSVEPDV